MFTLAMPQSLPRMLRKVSAAEMLFVKIAEESPCGTSLCHAMASSSFSNCTFALIDPPADTKRLAR